MTARAATGMAASWPAVPDAPHRTLAIDGTTPAYVEHGAADAECIVLLHGYVGSLSWRSSIRPSVVSLCPYTP
jgi:hypothetical protein